MNKVVLITGINGGIGQATAKIFFEKGWTVVGIDTRESSNPYSHYFFQKDVGKAADFDAVRSELQNSGIAHLDCLVNTAAIQIEKRLIDTHEEDWNRVFTTNVGSIFFAVKSLYELLRGGAIVNISSVHARATSPGLASYCASKGAVSALTRAMALELAEFGIRVNSILPGAIDTPMLRQGLNRSASPESAMARLIEASPLKRIGQPQDVAQLCYFLADPDLSSNITGQEFVTDSGVLARLPSE